MRSAPGMTFVRTGEERAPRRGEWYLGMAGECMADRDEMTQAIPPAYTEFIGRQLLQQVAA